MEKEVVGGGGGRREIKSERSVISRNCDKLLRSREQEELAIIRRSNMCRNRGNESLSPLRG